MHSLESQPADSPPLDPARLTANSSRARVEYHDTIGSTQDRAHELARTVAADELPLLVVAEEQTAGRGRGANRWWTGRGSLALSLVFDPSGWDLPAHPLPERSLAVGVAIVETLRPLVGNHALGLHWPNDVFLTGKKVAGILIDVVPGARHIVGIGLNVNNPLAAAPEEVRARATSLCEVTDRVHDRTAVLLSLLENLELAVRQSSTHPELIGRRFNDLCLQHGRPLTIEVGGQRTTGTCLGIAPDGALLLETPQGWQKFYSGVLVHHA